MSFGLDYVSGPPIANMKAIGVAFVCRYLSEVNEKTKIKLLTTNEAKALSQAGIAIVSNYEWYANRALEGTSAGAWDARVAEGQHATCGGPADRPIYFSVDIDTSGQAVHDYFKGIASVIGLHRTGAYGSYRVLKELFDAGAITWGWQTYAWSGGQWEARAHIQQYQNGVSMAGHSVDHNRSIKDDFGQWFSHAAPVPHTTPPQQGDEMIPLTINDVRQYFTANPDGSWTRIGKDSKPVLDSAGKPIVLSGRMKDDWCNLGNAVFALVGLPTENAVQKTLIPPIIIEQKFERSTRRLDATHAMDSPPHAGDVYSTHIENLYSAEVKLQMALDQLAATQKQLDALKAGAAPGSPPAGAAASPESAYVAAVKELQVHIKAMAAIADPLEV